jgi:antitoxin (DNA-binding transcriptional repressor) of toxin-antitoxin stability system
VLDRASQGEEFAIERDGEVIAVIRPLTPRGITWREFVAKYREHPRPDDRFADDLEAVLAERDKPGVTARELIAQVGNLPFPGDGFGDDLEAVQNAQPIAEMPEWPS